MTDVVCDAKPDEWPRKSADDQQYEKYKYFALPREHAMGFFLDEDFI
jgi:hypothetical protein